MNSNLPKKGIIYCRVSSAEQVDGTSLDTQQAACRAYCEQQGITVERVFVERGESAKTTDRTEFLAAIDYCKQAKKEISYFIVWKLDRFARQTTDHFKVKAILSQYGVTLQSVTETIGDDPQGNLMETILAGFAQFDNDIRAQRSRNGMLEKIRSGIWVWGAPYGYCRIEKGGNLVVDTQAAPFIRLVFETFASSDHTYDTVAELMQRRGYFSKKGKAPYRQLIAKVVRNPLYCGVIRIWGEEHKGAFEPIVTPELFNKCQERFRDKVKLSPRKARNPAFPLRRFVVCTACKAPLTGSASTGRHGKKYPYYHHQRQSCPKASFIPRDKLEATFVDYLADITPTPKFEKSFKAIVMDVYDNRYKTLEDSRRRHDRELNKLKLARQRIFDAHTAGIYSDEDFIQQKRDIEARIAKQQAVRPDAEAPTIDINTAVDFAFNLIRSAPESWPALDLPERERFQKLIFDGEITFDGEKFGTAKLSPIYALYRDFGHDLSTSVTPRGRIWNRLIPELWKWQAYSDDTCDDRLAA
jgi:DNA invertase Pin-like site-specific DNA recombinase